MRARGSPNCSDVMNANQDRLRFPQAAQLALRGSIAHLFAENGYSP
jgi:hypothetical protein